jgi:hypothetical protein
MGEVITLRPPHEEQMLLRGYTLDELTEVLGFKLGSLTLHRAGYTTLAAVIRAPEAELLRVHGIGPRKIALIRNFFRARGYTYPNSVRPIS